MIEQPEQPKPTLTEASFRNINPGDILRVSHNPGGSFFWEVAAVKLGARGQEDVVELTPIDQKPNAEGKTLCPWILLSILMHDGSAAIYSSTAKP